MGGHAQARSLLAWLPCHPQRSVLCAKPFAPCSCPATLTGLSPSITPSPLSSSIFPEACPLIRQPWRHRPPLAHLSQPTHSSLATCCHLCSPSGLPKPLLNHPPSLERHWRVRQAGALRTRWHHHTQSGCPPVCTQAMGSQDSTGVVESCPAVEGDSGRSEWSRGFWSSNQLPLPLHGPEFEKPHSGFCLVAVLISNPDASERGLGTTEDSY